MKEYAQSDRHAKSGIDSGVITSESSPLNRYDFVGGQVDFNVFHDITSFLCSL